MIDINFDTSELDKFIRKLEDKKKDLQKGAEKYYKFLQNQVHVEGRLREKIMNTVYAGNEPSQYQWTYDLLNSKRCVIEEDGLHLYMDDEWLASQPQAKETSYEYGEDPSAHTGESYAKRVEEGYTYDNPGGKVVNQPAAEYMKETFDEIKEGFDSDQFDKKKIFDALITNWSR